MKEVIVTSFDKRFTSHIKDMEHIARSVLSFINKGDRGVEIYLIGNVRMRSLNRKFRGKDKSTNVLSFCSPREFPDDESIGEVYLCPPYIKLHKEKIDYLLVHGILHLAGFNHENKSDRMKMEKLEMKIMKWLNLTY